MPGRRNPPAKWVLPDVIDPPKRRCYVIEVPEDIHHIGAFYGAIANLASATQWQDDPDHKARQVALVWRDIFDQLKQQDCDAGDCPTPIDEWEDDVSLCQQLRVKDGKLQALCCGEWQDIDGQEGLPDGGQNQPGPGATVPGPGDCQTYHASLNTNMQWFLPPVVNAGDVLTFSNSQGASQDGLELLGIGRWYCANGGQYFAGQNIGGPKHISGDPSSTLWHMQLTAFINGVYYAADSGAITVPSGVKNATVTLQVNDASLGDNSGSLSVDVEVCNNQAATWTAHLGFEISSWDFVNFTDFTIAPPNTGVWAAGIGWQGSDVVVGGNTYHGVNIYRALGGHFAFTSGSMTMNYTKGTINPTSQVATVLNLHNSGSTVVQAGGYNQDVADGSPQLITLPLGAYTVDEIIIGINDANYPTGSGADGVSLAISLDFAGTGDNPFPPAF